MARFLSVFDVIGPVMIGPSSSHTAGAVRLGRMVRAVLGGTPQRAEIKLHGSFARTFRGHGTDRAIVAGLLGFATDDERVRDALSIARNSGLEIEISATDLVDVHPNSTLIMAEGEGLGKVTVLGSSIGGGEAVIREINGFELELRGHYPTLLVLHIDKPGIIAAVTGVIAKYGVNIATMEVSRRKKGEEALMVIETDQPLTPDLISMVAQLKDVTWVREIVLERPCVTGQVKGAAGK